MATTAIPLPRTSTRAEAGTRVPWHYWTLVVAVILVTVGGQADVSWHRSIGRDSFWTPPHMMVYLCGLLAAISCGYLILACTFGRDRQLQTTAIDLFGLRAPTGVLLTAWGGLTMLASSPFDNWWHNAYGLDVQVQSPPHIVLLAGTWAVCQGTLLVAAAHMNRARMRDEEGEQAASPYLKLFLFIGALSVIHLMSYSMSYTFDTRLHGWKPYVFMSAGVPFALAALAAAARRRWTATIVTGIYTVFMLALVWCLPLIPAHPRLGPVYQNVTHLIPPKFPILLMAPALALDLLWQRLHRINRGLLAALSGLTYLVVLVGTEWPFATFLMSPRAANRFFGTIYFDFGTPEGSADPGRYFENPVHGLHLFAGLAAAAIVAAIGIRMGEVFGKWMRQVVR